MTPATAIALQKLSQLGRLFDDAQGLARSDSGALTLTLGEAAMMLDEIAPAMAASTGGPDEALLAQAATDVRERHLGLLRTIGGEIERITAELERLSRSSRATARYGAAPRAPRLRLLERSA